MEWMLHGVPSQVAGHHFRGEVTKDNSGDHLQLQPWFFRAALKFGLLANLLAGGISSADSDLLLSYRHPC